MSRFPSPVPLTLSSLVLTIAIAGCGESPEVPSREPPAPAGVAVVPAGGLAPVTSVAVSSPVRAALTLAEAEAAYRAGDFVAAREGFHQLAEQRPDDHHTHYMLGLAAWKSGELRRAEAALDRALALDPADARSWIHSARVLLELDRAHEALERADQALVRDSTSGEALRLRARAQARVGDREAARETYRRAIALDERDVWSMNNLGVLELEYGDPEAALGPLARAVQLRGSAPVFQNNFGMALERSGHLAEAARAYAAAVAADSTYGKARANRDRVQAVAGADGVPDDRLVATLAEEFRARVRMWKDSFPRPEGPN